MKKIDQIYHDLCKKLLVAPEVNGTREIRNSMITFDATEDSIISIRDISPAYLFGEWLWYFNGDYHIDFISKYGSTWEKMSDDGVSANSAYGNLIKREFRFNQFETVVNLLRNDPSSRRAIININTPRHNVATTKDEPCTIALQYFVRDKKVHSTAMMRSNDIWYGFPYDVAFFVELQRRVAEELNLDVGEYTHFAGSLHVYNKDLDKIKSLNNSKPVIFDRKKFHQREKMVFNMIRQAIDECSNKEIKELTLKLAEMYFGYERGAA